MVTNTQPRPQGFSLKKWEAIFQGKSPGEITLQRQWDLYKLCNISRPILHAREAT